MAKAMGISRASLYYVAKQHGKDWALKVRMEEVLQEHPSYGSRRLALALHVNRKRTKRVMQLFGIRPYRRRGRKYREAKAKRTFPNLLLGAAEAINISPVKDNVVERHACSCPQGRSRARISASWKVLIPLSLFHDRAAPLTKK